MFDYIFQDGADPNCTNKDGMPVLHVAALNKQIDALDTLVENGADVNKKGPKYVIVMELFTWRQNQNKKN